MITIELSQARVHVKLNEDLGGNLSVVNPTESHQSEEILSKVWNKVTSSQSEIFSVIVACSYVFAFQNQTPSLL